MKIKKIFVLIVLNSLISTVCAQDSYNVNDFSKDKVQTLKKIEGKYKSSNGELLDVNFTFFEPAGQLNLFNLRKFEFSIDFEGKYENYFFELDSLEIEEGGGFTFSQSEDDCDNPGCSNYEVYLYFKKDASDSFSASMSISVEVDVEEASYVFENNPDLNHNELSVLLNEECVGYYGESAYLIDFVDDYKNSVYCGYEKEIVFNRL